MRPPAVGRRQRWATRPATIGATAKAATGPPAATGASAPRRPQATRRYVDASGGYLLTITGDDVAKSLTITAPGVDVQDKCHGSLTLSGALTVDGGSFSLDGGTLSAAAIEVGANGHFIGGGTVSAPIDNNGVGGDGGGFVEAGHGGEAANLALMSAPPATACTRSIAARRWNSGARSRPVRPSSSPKRGACSRSTTRRTSMRRSKTLPARSRTRSSRTKLS